MDRRSTRSRTRKNLQYDNILLDPDIREKPDQQLVKDKCFPFELLPVDCQFKIFSYLDHLQKGKIFTVCKRWYHILLHPSLWCQLSIWNFPDTCLKPESPHDNDHDRCYHCYKKRVHEFSRLILKINPRPRRFEFKLNIAEVTSGYREIVGSLFKQLSWKELSVAYLSFKETPLRPYWVPNEDQKDNDIIYRHRLRARYFVNLFDLFTKKAIAIQTLAMPFDWSPRAVKCLTRLKNIHSLILEKYYVFRSLDQDLLAELLACLPSLQKFMLEVWSPSGLGLSLYTVSSKSLVYLDISQSRGFYLRKLDMPKLETFRVLRHPWNGPFVTSDKVNIPCLYKVLVSGAPNLVKINDHYLEEGWKEFCYPRLDEVLRTVCSCRLHKSGWYM